MTVIGSNGSRPRKGPVRPSRENARVCLVSQRGLNRQLSRCCGFEFEDVIASIDDVSLVQPVHAWGSALRLKVRNRVSRMSELYRLVNSGIQVTNDINRFDLFFMLIQFTRDLMTFDAVRHLRRKSGFAICYLEEIWLADFERLGPQLDVLKEFDYIFCSCAGSVDPLSERLQRPVEYIPPAVDAIRFAPRGDAGRRFIDVINIGRRSEVTHRALLKYAQDQGKFYLYDTLEAPYLAMAPHEHRMLLANQIKHSRYFIANTAKMNRQFETTGQAEIGFRFFEGLAGGAVLLGDPPPTEQFTQHLGWEDTVIAAPFDCADIADIIAELEAQPSRLQAIRQRNVLNMVRRHDWLYRWEVILARAGLTQTPAMKGRAELLGNLEESISASWSGHQDECDPRPVAMASLAEASSPALP